MEGHYEFDNPSFPASPPTQPQLLHGISLKRNRLPVLIKRFDVFMGRNKAEFLEEFNEVINKGLMQARVSHVNAWKIVEMRVDVDFDRGRYSVFHIGETVEGDLGKEIEERKVPFSDMEIVKFLRQTAGALAYTHSQGIPHRDLTPAHVYVDKEGDFKLSDFQGLNEHSEIESLGTEWDPYKEDVYALGAVAVALGEKKTVTDPWPREELREKARNLPYSREIKDVLAAMLASDSVARPSMQTVSELIASLSKCPSPGLNDHLKNPDSHQIPAQPTVFPFVWFNNVIEYDIRTQEYTPHLLGVNFSGGGSYIQATYATIFCVGAYPPSGNVYELSLASHQLRALAGLATPRDSPGLACVCIRRLGWD